ncbi:MAG TPA: tRNA (N6-threonylcarbamoyladenosine(37)-N6)-methyltransferase TrmO [candidate division Zixibacteria bacterium]|nr:tRNA (N6-threonylcarbamoyladenosine(37)-N6)-methyltransferase TrmO [candidate division Zixibacteria bacterium]
MEFKPIGIIHTPFTDRANMPIQPSGGAGVEGTIELFEEYREGLKDLDGFSHITLLFHFHKSDSYKLLVVPYLDTELRGVFATRAPRRPNPIGLSTVELIRIEDCTLHIRNLDMLDGTPLLDIKPYVPDFDRQTEVRSGWLEEARKQARTKRSDGRFR